jgi:hypothetical protein
MQLVRFSCGEIYVLGFMVFLVEFCLLCWSLFYGIAAVYHSETANTTNKTRQKNSTKIAANPKSIPC